MIDLVPLLVKAGDGGDGRVSFFRAKYITKGGPDGGEGGRGGNVWIKASGKMSSLKHLAGVKSVSAQAGEIGGRRKKTGSSADDVEIEVPVGTRVWLIAQNQTASYRFELNGLSPLPRSKIHLKRYYLNREGEPIPFDQDHSLLASIENNDLIAPLSHQPAKILVELKENGQRVLLCQGGIGGKGNVTFARSDHQTPLEAEYGYPGEIKQVELELRLLADIGLVGLPSVGKSTLLSILTSSHPKIAAYPFTTLEPNLGIMSLPEKRSLIIADIPGIIAGANQGKGLGTQFLRHASHCRAICYVLAISDEGLIMMGNPNNYSDLVMSLWQQYQVVKDEIALSYPELLDLLSIVVLNKVDLYPKEFIDQTALFFRTKSIEFLPISGATKQGLEQLKVLFDQVGQKS